ncbi:tRNA dihydrouridine synthase DusB [Methylosoma difficile]
MQIGPHQLPNPLILAPMAGVSDRPFREICIRNGAGLAVSEMVASNPALLHHKKSLQRTDHNGETGLRSVQILGTDPSEMAAAAKLNAQRGAQIIDINMGCPAKKVCSVAAGSALLKDEDLVKRILEAVVNAVDVPVTLKIRTGWDTQHRNAVTIAQIAEASGIAALTIHGRTRACKFEGQAEYDTIKAVKQSVNIPVIANGDIDSPAKALQVLQNTDADAIMIGRAAQGNPWLFGQILHFLSTGEHLPGPSITEIQQTLTGHLENLYRFYGDTSGVRIARKHIAWYLKQSPPARQDDKDRINQASTPSQQIARVGAVFYFLTNGFSGS